MSGSVFTWDARGTPLMPMSSAYARHLLGTSKAQWVPHHALPIIRLSQTVAQPVLRPILLGLRVHLHTAELLVVADSERVIRPLLRVVVDLRTDLPVRLRRRAEHRRRRRARGRYRSARRYRLPFKLRRPSLAHSSWGRLLRPGRRRRGPGIFRSPTMHWRAQAILRVISALREIVPISHVLVRAPLNMPEPQGFVHSAADLRQQLIDTYGYVTADGTRIAMCAYCRTTEGRIEAEHILPVSRGGTDGWRNRVLSCAICNARKADRTPEEAGMTLHVKLTDTPPQPDRAGVYARWTTRLLLRNLRQTQLTVSWPQKPGECPEDIPSALYDAIAQLQVHPAELPIIVAKPVARPVKQVFSSRNYPQTTELRAGFVRFRDSIRRRIRVNQKLAITTQNGRRRVQVVPVGAPEPDHATQVVTHGMLCEGLRSGRTVVGIVAAIHSTGRVTLLVPGVVMPNNVSWQRVVISPRQHLRILSTERVLFLPVLSGSADANHNSVKGEAL